MKKLLLLLLLLPLVVAQPTDWFQAQSVKTELKVSSTIELIPRGPNPFVESVTANVIFVPQNSQFLAVREINAAPPATITGDHARYEWRAVPIGTLSYGYTAIVEVANNAPHVGAKIPFPIQIPRGFEKYVQPTKNIDSNDPAIIGQANYIVQGEDDLFVAVSKLAMWTKNNVQYNLSTLTADVSQKASWVLQNKYGVCDEITSLFIAMLRTLKIPARFVSGLAFTNSPQFPLGWGAHGWAEVYFPGVGWVPFDPTFGEFGWIDPGHIKLKESLDPQEPTTVFEWKARDVDVTVHDLELSATRLETKGVIPSELRTTLTTMRPRVGFGSYNGIILDVENLADYYVAPEFALTRVSDMTIMNGESQQIVLPPRGKGRIVWKVQLRKDFDPKYQYEIPLQIYTIRNDTIFSTFASGKWDIVFSEKDVDSEIQRQATSKSDQLQLACAFENDFVWTDVGKVNCAVQNRGDKELDVQVCFNGCRNIIVPAKQNVPISFDVEARTPGPHQVEISATAETMMKKAILTLVRLDEPSIAVKDISAPETVSYGEPFVLSFTLSRDSVSLPQNVSVEVKGSGARAVVDVGELDIDQEIKVNIHSEQLYSSRPTFSINVDYKDPFGKEYKTRRSASIRILGIPWYKNIIGWLIDLF